MIIAAICGVLAMPVVVSGIDPWVSPPHPHTSIGELRGQACQVALMQHFRHPATVSMSVSNDGLVLVLRMRHRQRDLPHMVMHAIQYFEMVAQTGFVAAFEDAHNSHGAGHLMERQAISAARAFRFKHFRVCDGRSM